MSKKMLVNATQHEENRVAIVEDGILTELDIEVAGHEPTKGNIYRAVVVRVESGLQAAFVDYGAERLGFLQIDEINYKAVKPDYQPAENGRRPKITDLLQRGQELLVQITKEERGTKGAALTTYLSLAGRYMVIMPGSQTRGVSRKAENEERKELKQAMKTFDMAENIGYIIRTAALNQTREELERDYRYLIRLYESITDLNEKVKAPALLYKESNLIIRSIRDYFTIDMEEVLIDDSQVFKEAKDFFQMVMPDYARLVKLHQERRPIFSRYQIEDQIEILNRNKVPLPSGGSIVIDPTEALVSIDVNSGKMASEQGVEATATKTNIEAATEIGRQLRLRDLGGLVVIDFIDMRDRKHAREVEQALKKSLQNDKARVSIGRISQFGLLEMSRQRLKATLADGSYLTCPHCQGTGKLKSPETQAASLLRKIHASAAKGQAQKVDAQLPLDVAAYLLNCKREELVEMERDHNLQIHIHGNRDFHADQVEIEITKKEKDKEQQHEFVSASSIAHPAPDSNTDNNAADGAQKDEGAQPEPDKKRRRRRRRKPTAKDNGAAQEVNQQNTGGNAEEPSQQSPAQPGDSSAEGKEKEGDDAASEKKQPSRRGRPSSRGKKSAEQPQNEKKTDKEAQEPSSPEESEKAQGEKQEEAEKPKRRSPRKSKPTTQEQSEEKNQTDTPAEQAAKIAPQPAGAEGGELSKPKGRGRRKKSPDENKTNEAPSSAQENSSLATEEPAAKPKRTRRSTKKTSGERTSPAKAPEQDNVQQATNEDSSQKTDAEKPAPRRGRRKKPSAQDAETQTEQKKAVTPEAASQETEKKPTQRRTPRRQTKPEGKSTGQQSDSQENSKKQATEDKQESPKRRATRKTQGRITTEENNDRKSDASEASQEAPKPKRRRTTKKKADETVDSTPESPQG